MCRAREQKKLNMKFTLVLITWVVSSKVLIGLSLLLSLRPSFNTKFPSMPLSHFL